MKVTTRNNKSNSIVNTSTKSISISAPTNIKYQIYHFKECNIEIRDVDGSSIPEYSNNIVIPVDDRYKFYLAPDFDNYYVAPIGTLCAKSKKLVYRDSVGSADFYISTDNNNDTMVVYKYLLPHDRADIQNNSTVIAKTILWPLAAVADVATSPFQFIYLFIGLTGGAFSH
jgi:hypothetical protein